MALAFVFLLVHFCHRYKHVREVSDDFLAKMIDRCVWHAMPLVLHCVGSFPYLLWDKSVLFRMLDLMNILQGSMLTVTPPTESADI